jgi:hypothetical protein
MTEYHVDKVVRMGEVTAEPEQGSVQRYGDTVYEHVPVTATGTRIREESAVHLVECTGQCVLLPIHAIRCEWQLHRGQVIPPQNTHWHVFRALGPQSLVNLHEGVVVTYSTEVRTFTWIHTCGWVSEWV